MLGGYYALLACGLSFMFGVMRIINLAHGSLAVLAAYMLFVLAERFEVHPLLGLVVVVPVMALIGWVLHRLVLERSARAGALLPLLSTFGLASVLDNSMFQAFGADTRSLAPYIDSLSFDGWTLPGGIIVGQLAVLTLVVAMVLLGGLHLMLARTALGRRIRAAAHDPDTAQLVGVDAARGVCGVNRDRHDDGGHCRSLPCHAGHVRPLHRSLQLIFAFEAVIIGGAGSLWGTLVGGIVLGIAQSIGAQVHPQGFLIAGHVVFLVVLLARVYAADTLRRWTRTFRSRFGSQATTP